MIKAIKVTGKIAFWLIIVLATVIILFFIVRAIGKAYYGRTPEG